MWIRFPIPNHVILRLHSTLPQYASDPHNQMLRLIEKVVNDGLLSSALCLANTHIWRIPLPTESQGSISKVSYIIPNYLKKIKKIKKTKNKTNQKLPTTTVTLKQSPKNTKAYRNPPCFGTPLFSPVQFVPSFTAPLKTFNSDSVPVAEMAICTRTDCH